MKHRPQRPAQSRSASAAQWEGSRRPEREGRAGWVPLVRQDLRECAGGARSAWRRPRAGRSGPVRPLGPCWPRFLQMIPSPALPQNGSGSCLVDMSAVWWEAADFAELCVVTAEETSVSLWRPLHLGQWGTVHTWHFAKVGKAAAVLAAWVAPPWACCFWRASLGPPPHPQLQSFRPEDW